MHKYIANESEDGIVKMKIISYVNQYFNAPGHSQDERKYGVFCPAMGII